MKQKKTLQAPAVARAALENKRTLLLHRLDAIKKDFAKGLNRDSSERAVELENAETLNEIVRVTEEELTTVETKLAQI